MKTNPRRSESLVKEFVPLNLGVIRLKKGKRPLVLSALEIPGKQSIEMRLIMLNRISTTSIPVSEDALK